MLITQEMLFYENKTIEYIWLCITIQSHH